MDQANRNDYCVLDIETAGGDFDRIPQGFELLVAGVWWQGKHHFYTHAADQLRSLASFLESFTGTVVTFNGSRFDLPILNDHLLKIVGRTIRLPNHYDILIQFVGVAGHRVSLANLAHDTLGRTKREWDHSQNGRVWREEPERLLEYNRADLDLTASLYEVILRGEPLRVGNKKLILSPPL